jgi:putative membrane protein
MKRPKSCKNVLFGVIFSAAILFSVSSCGDDKPKDTKDAAEKTNDAKLDNTAKEKDAQFLVNAAEINLEEISLGKLARQKGNTAHVKELGKMMEDEHTKSWSDLSALAKIKMITLPESATDNAKDAYKKLNDKSEKDFGKAYSDMMVNGHKDAIALFEKAAADCSDPDIRAWATATLPALRAHLEHSEMCQKECEKM